MRQTVIFPAVIACWSQQGWQAAPGGMDWLGGRDSNPDTMVQSHVSYR